MSFIKIILQQFQNRCRTLAQNMNGSQLEGRSNLRIFDLDESSEQNRLFNKSSFGRNGDCKTRNDKYLIAFIDTCH